MIKLAHFMILTEMQLSDLFLPRCSLRRTERHPNTLSSVYVKERGEVLAANQRPILLAQSVRVTVLISFESQLLYF